MTFIELGLIEPILKALETEGYSTPTPIQEQAIPEVLKGRDLLGCAQTGTGKTAAFALPIIQLHHQAPPSKSPVRIKTLILTPTRELAIQIGESFQVYGVNTKIRQTVIFGGVGQHPQTEALRRGVEVLIATPGRLLDLMQQGFVHLNDLEVFVLDEADRMLDMGFIHDVRKVIAKLPSKRQTLFFSATMPPEIQKLADTILHNPVQVAVTPVSSTAEKVAQTLYFVEKREKKDLLNHLLANEEIKSALVFSRTKHGANKIAKELNSVRIGAEAIHGNKSQTARQSALSNFKSGKTRVLVATDIAARGIDIDDLAYVFNYDLPNIPETYVHRIGRTGRAGASGQAISFCDMEERAFLRDIEKLIGKKVPVATIEPGVIKVRTASEVNEDESDEPRAGHQPRQQQRQQQQRQQQQQQQPQEQPKKPKQDTQRPNNGFQQHNPRQQAQQNGQRQQGNQQERLNNERKQANAQPRQQQTQQNNQRQQGNPTQERVANDRQQNNNQRQQGNPPQERVANDRQQSNQRPQRQQQTGQRTQVAHLQEILSNSRQRTNNDDRAQYNDQLRQPQQPTQREQGTQFNARTDRQQRPNNDRQQGNNQPRQQQPQSNQRPQGNNNQQPQQRKDNGFQQNKQQGKSFEQQPSNKKASNTDTKKLDWDDLDDLMSW
jgi:ATP-dependent RNA helicase RhlE